MKKVLAILLSIVLLVSLFVACSGNRKQTDGEDKISVVTTIFPIYDWVREVAVGAEDNTELTFLLDNGVDLHNYQPTADDMIKISDCDLFIYVGGESDAWVEDALKNAQNKEMKVINLLETLGEQAKEEETVEGMQEEDGEDNGEDEAEYDEHVWLSVRNAQLFVSKIASSLGELSPDKQAVFLNNAKAYEANLAALDAAYQDTADNAAVKTLVFGDRFPFRYMTDDYGLSYYAAFSGCSAETEASFETISFLAQKTDELGLKYVMTIEGTDHRIAETIINNTQSKQQEILVLDSMQGTTAEDVQNGITYLAVMQQNLQVLKTALSA